MMALWHADRITLSEYDALTRLCHFAAALQVLLTSQHMRHLLVSSASSPASVLQSVLSIVQQALHQEGGLAAALTAQHSADTQTVTTILEEVNERTRPLLRRSALLRHVMTLAPFALSPPQQPLDVMAGVSQCPSAERLFSVDSASLSWLATLWFSQLRYVVACAPVRFSLN